MPNADVNIDTGNGLRINGLSSRPEATSSTSTTTPTLPIQNSTFCQQFYGNSIRTNSHPPIYANVMDSSRPILPVDTENEEILDKIDGTSSSDTSTKYFFQRSTTEAPTDTKNIAVDRTTSQSSYVLKDRSEMATNPIAKEIDNYTIYKTFLRKNEYTTNDSSITVSKSLGSHSILRTFSSERFQVLQQQRQQQQINQPPLHEQHNRQQTINSTLPSLRYDFFQSQPYTNLYML
jgi:hypothetical protein